MLKNNKKYYTKPLTVDPTLDIGSDKFQIKSIVAVQLKDERDPKAVKDAEDRIAAGTPQPDDAALVAKGPFPKDNPIICCKAYVLADTTKDISDPEAFVEYKPLQLEGTAAGKEKIVALTHLKHNALNEAATTGTIFVYQVTK